ncbi:hypothetical protein EMIT0196MI5_230010 [Pseudomonas sp. IT-196MI5]
MAAIVMVKKNEGRLRSDSTDYLTSLGPRDDDTVIEYLADEYPRSLDVHSQLTVSERCVSPSSGVLPTMD